MKNIKIIILSIFIISISLFHYDSVFAIEYHEEIIEESLVLEDEPEIMLGANSTIESGSCGDNLTYTIYLNGDNEYVLKISGTGDMTNYWDGTPWSNYSDIINIIEIENGVTHISICSFENFSALKGDLIIPNSVLSIGGNAFFNCSGFDGNLVLSENLTYIGDAAFYHCSGFTGNLSLPNSLLSIGNNVFNSCNGFTGNLSLPNNLSSIGRSAFFNCNGFTGNLSFPNSVSSIGRSAFYNCSGFTGDLSLPDNLTSIGNSAFHNCEGFDGELILPEELTSIGDSVFKNCSGLTGDLTLPDNLTSIGNWAFYHCSGFTGDLSFPDNLTSIGNYAFDNCSGFTGDLSFPDNLTSIGDYAFDNCSGFTGNLSFPNSLLTIGDSAFLYCEGFNGDLILPENLTYIHANAFIYCSKLKRIENNSTLTININSISYFTWKDQDTDEIINTLNPNSTALISYKIIFNTNAESIIDNQYVCYDDTIQEPDTSVFYHFGHSFKKWYKDSNCSIEWDFSDSPTNNMTLYADWEPLNYDLNNDGIYELSFTDAKYYGTSLGVDWIIFNNGILYVFGEQNANPTQASDWGWYEHRQDVLEAYLDFDSEYSLAYFFKGCTNFVGLSLSDYSDLSNITSTREMFSECTNLTYVDIAQFQIDDVVDTSYMFDGCSSIVTIIFSNDYVYFNTTNNTDFSYMFRNCPNIQYLNLSEFYMDSAENVTGMLDGCSGLVNLLTPATESLQIQLPKTMYNWDDYNTPYDVIPSNTDSSLNLYDSLDSTYYSVTINTDGNGTATASTTIERAGNPVYITISPNEGFALDTYTSDDNGLELISNDTIMFIMPSKNTRINLTFNKIETFLSEKIENNDGTFTFNLVKGQKYTVSEFKKIPKTTYNVIQSKSDKKIASISTKGVISAKKIGTTNLDLLIGDRLIQIKINVYNPSFVYENPKLKYFIVNANDCIKLNFDSAGFKPSYLMNVKQRNIATVDPDTGIVTGIKKGKATIYAMVNGKKYKTIVQVYDPLINCKDSIKVGKTLSVKIKNGVKNTQWSVINGTGTATIDAKGKLKGIAAGTVTVVAINNGRILKKDITIIDNAKI